LLLDPDISEIGCPGENDAVARLQVAPFNDQGDTNEFNDIGEADGQGPFAYSLFKDGDPVAFPITVADDTMPAIFEFLGPCDDDMNECYTYFVTNEKTGCQTSDSFNIAPKDPLFVMLDQASSVAPICKDDVTGTRVYNVSGATPPYHYVLLDNPNDPEPTAEELIVNGALVPATNQIILEDLMGDIPYRLFVIDSGNGLEIGDEDLILCDPFEFEFEFETEDLDLFDVVTSPNCDDLTYTVGVL